MMRTVGFVLLWLAGSTTAIAVAWTGVDVVDDELVDPAPAGQASSTLGNEPFEVGESSDTTSAGAATSRPDSATEASTRATVASSPVSGSASTSLVSRSPTSSTTASVTEPSTSGAPTSALSTPAPSSTTPPTTTPSTTAPSTTAPTTTTTSTTQSTQTLTFNLVGGATAISFSPGGVTVLWATPNPGFEVKVEPESPGVKVEFRADHHRSRIDAWWSGGPQHDIREEPDD